MPKYFLGNLSVFYNTLKRLLQAMHVTPGVRYGFANAWGCLSVPRLRKDDEVGGKDDEVGGKDDEKESVGGGSQRERNRLLLCPSVPRLRKDDEKKSGG